MLKSILKKDNNLTFPSEKKVVFSKKNSYKIIPNRLDINNVSVSETFSENNKLKEVKLKKPKIKNDMKFCPNLLFIFIFIVIMLMLLICNSKSDRINLQSEVI